MLRVVLMSVFGIVCIGQNLPAMPCSFLLSSSGFFQDKLASLPETGMGLQIVEVELKSGAIVGPVEINGGTLVTYHGPQTFTEADIKKIHRIFNRSGQQVWP